MARTNRAEAARRNANTARVNRGTYVDGNTVRRLSELPDRREYPVNPGKKSQSTRRNKPSANRQAVSSTPKKLSKQAHRNREKAMGMSKGFVAFLAVMCVAILFCSVNYLRYKSQITGKMSTVASLEAELAQLKEDNDAYYSQVTSNIDLNNIKKIAIGRLGMKYPSKEQTVTYETEGNSYVRQYQDIPDSK